MTIADLAPQLGAPLPTVGREVNRLKDAGLLTRRATRAWAGGAGNQNVPDGEADPFIRQVRDRPQAACTRRIGPPQSPEVQFTRVLRGVRRQLWPDERIRSAEY